MTDVPLHTIQPIVTPDKFECGVHRMRVPGGWLYWLQPGGAMVASFVPDLSELGPVAAIAPEPLAPLKIEAVCRKYGGVAPLGEAAPEEAATAVRAEKESESEAAPAPEPAATEAQEERESEAAPIA